MTAFFFLAPHRKKDQETLDLAMMKQLARGIFNDGSELIFSFSPGDSSIRFMDSRNMNAKW